MGGDRTATERKPIRVLHVDDDRDLVELTAEYLEREDGRLAVTTATDVRSALETIESETIDCIVSDYDMAPKNGLEFLRTVRADHEELPFILLTGKGSEEIASEAISEGVTDYLQKGYGIDRYSLLVNRIVNAVEQYRSRQALEESRKRLELFFDQSPLGVVEWNPEFELVRLNWTAQDLLGYTESELRGVSWEELVPPRERDDVRDVMAKLSDSAGGYHHVTETIREDGERITCEWHNRVVTDEDDEPIAILSQFWDITDRRRRQRAIAELHDVAADLTACETPAAVYRRTIEAAESLLSFDYCLIATVEDDGLQVVETSETVPDDAPALLDESGALEAYRDGETTWRNDLEVDEAPIFESDFSSVVHVPIEDTGVFQASNAGADGFEDTDVELAELLVRHADSRLDRLRYEETLEEKTERLQQQNERLDEFVSVVGHDLRSPLQVISGTLDLAERTGDPVHFDRCRRAADRMDRLLDNLMTLAREDTLTEVEPFEIDDAARTAWRNVDTHEAELEVTVDRTVEADRSRAVQLFENLFNNAVEHAGKDATITVGELDDGIYVEDDGPGIPESERDQVFERGYSGTTNGTGFGLAIVDKIASDHGWDVSVTDGENGGARFEISGIEAEEDVFLFE